MVHGHCFPPRHPCCKVLGTQGLPVPLPILSSICKDDKQNESFGACRQETNCQKRLAKCKLFKHQAKGFGSGPAKGLNVMLMKLPVRNLISSGLLSTVTSLTLGQGLGIEAMQKTKQVRDLFPHHICSKQGKKTRTSGAPRP